MTLKEIEKLLPDYARDLKYNLSVVLHKNGLPGLTMKQVSAVAVATSSAGSSMRLAEAVKNFAREHLSNNEINGAATAHAIMSMTNVYYRFLHSIANPTYKTLPSGLRRVSENNPGIESDAFHLAALGVSAINHCKVCMDYHERILLKSGVSVKGIQSAVRIASVVNAVGEVLKFE